MLSSPQKSDLCSPGDLVSLSQDQEADTLALSGAWKACSLLPTPTPTPDTARQERVTLGSRENGKEKEAASRGGERGSSEDPAASCPQPRLCVVSPGQG